MTSLRERRTSVSADAVGVTNSENAQISTSLSPRDVLDLPANYRGAGSTSPMNVIQTLPGIQPDTSGYAPSPSTHPQPSLKFSIQGGLPSQSETTVDGISAQNQTNNNTQNDAFPSAEAIAEIRVELCVSPFNNDRTVVRGGVGYYNITTTGAVFYAIAQTPQSNFQTFTQS